MCEGPSGGAGPRVTQSRQHEATNSERWGTQLGRNLVARRHGVFTLGPSSGSPRGTGGDDLYWSGQARESLGDRQIQPLSDWGSRGRAIGRNKGAQRSCDWLLDG